MSVPWWVPKNAAEAALAEAAERGDRAEFLRVFASAELYLPQVPKPGVVQREGSEEWAPLTRQVSGHTTIPVFTSLAGMGSAVFVGAYAVTTYPEIREKWAEPGWWLAINPGLPIEAHLPVEAVDQTARDDIEDEPELTDLTVDPDQILNDPEYPASLDEYLDALLDATVIVPTGRAVSVADELLEPGFPWVVAGPPGTPTIEVFTTEIGFEAAYPGAPYLRTPFLLLMLAWPEGQALAVNPGGPVRMTWPADQIRSLRERAVTGGDT